MNKCFISGNLTYDPTLKTSVTGTQILTFGIAFNDRRRNPQTNEWESVPNYADCTIFGNRAQGLAPYLTKGTKVALEGRLHWSSWEKDGQKRSKLEVYVDEVEFLSPHQGHSAPQNAPQPGYAPQSRNGYANPQQPPMAPQMAPQAPAVPQYGGYQPTQQPPMQQQPVYIEDSDIPF